MGYTNLNLFNSPELVLSDFNCRNKALTAKFPRQGYRYNIRMMFAKFYCKQIVNTLKVTDSSGNLLNRFANYLSNRKQRVVINEKMFSYLNVIAGVPQSSILDPLLFLIYINDIVLELNCNIRLFADDTSLYIIVENPLAAADIMRSSLSTVHAWSNQWLVDFNAVKTETMVVSRKRVKLKHPNLIMDTNIL